MARGARAAMDMAFFVATRHGHRLKFSCYTQNSKLKNVVRHGFYVFLCNVFICAMEERKSVVSASLVSIGKQLDDWYDSV